MGEMGIFDQMTPVNKRKLISRISIFVIYSVLGIINVNWITELANIRFGPIRLYHLIWFGVAGFFAFNLFYKPSKKISSGRQYAKFYEPNPRCDPEQLNREIKKSNSRALKAAALVLSINGGFIVSYFLFDLHVFWVYFLALLYIVLDAVFITLWCPFRNWIMKNKCCNTCRIHNWGFWMAAFPLLAVPSFWTYSIVVLGFLILIKWEVYLRKFPERFYALSNSNLECKNCTHASGFYKELKKA